MAGIVCKERPEAGKSLLCRDELRGEVRAQQRTVDVSAAFSTPLLPVRDFNTPPPSGLLPAPGPQLNSSRQPPWSPLWAGPGCLSIPDTGAPGRTCYCAW